MVRKLAMFYPKFSLLLLLFISISGNLYGQGQALEMAYYQVLQKAERLENSGNYEAAYQSWNELDASDLSLDQNAQRAFKMAYLGLVVGYKEGPGAMKRFVREYPSAPEVKRAYTTVGHYYFTKGQYANALAWYKEAEGFQALTEQHEFEIAYAHFKLGNFSEAKRFFGPLESSPNYGSRALYYSAYIDYQNKKWQQALEKLDRIDLEQRDDLEVWGLMADLSFRTSNFEQAAAWGIRALDAIKISGDKRNINQGSLNGIVGRAYAQMGAHAIAVNYLEKAVDKPSRQKQSEEHLENQFYLGQAYATLGQNEKAIAVLSNVQAEGLLAQEVAYVLAGAYLALDQKTEALNAYKKACETPYERPFTSKAYYQYAKLTYDLRLSYTSVPDVLESFINRYPQDPKRGEVEQWWLSTLLESKDYDQVIAYLSAPSLLTDNVMGEERQSALQRAYFLKGRQQYDQGLSLAAQNSFQQAQKIKSNSLIGGQAMFWSGVIFGESGAFESALSTFDKLMDSKAFKKAPEWSIFHYEQAFAYMALKNYSRAQEGFLNYLKQPKPIAKENEARLNLADCYFASKDYKQALAQYNRVLDNGGVNEDYADFQAAMCLSFTQGLEAKTQRLVKFLMTYPNSVYRDRVYLSLGSAYVSLDKIAEAKAQYTQLISEQKNSPLVASAYLSLGLIADNNSEFEQALNYFKSVVNLYPGTQEAISAVQSARNTFISLGRVQEYGAWVDELDFISIDQAALDQASFESAKQAYAGQNDALSVERFEAYLENYTQGRYALEAHYILSEIYWRQQEVTKALLHADFVIAADENPSFIIPTLIRVARHYLSNQEFAEAESSLIKLLTQPLDADQRTFALSNLMQMMSDQSRWQQAIHYTNDLTTHLSNNTQDPLLTQARLISAWSYFELKEFDLAREQYKDLDDFAKGQYGAQLNFAQAYFAHLDQDYLRSNELIQNLAQNYANYMVYGARGLMLMAKNFEALSDPFQARFILENIRDNMQDFPELQQEAAERLEKMDQSKNAPEPENSARASEMDSTKEPSSNDPKDNNQKEQND